LRHFSGQSTGFYTLLVIGRISLPERCADLRFAGDPLMADAADVVFIPERIAVGDKQKMTDIVAGINLQILAARRYK
jgi:hypothetical protein